MENLSSEPSFDARVPTPTVELLTQTIIDSFEKARLGTHSIHSDLNSETQFLRSEMEKRIAKIKSMAKPRLQLPPRFDRFPFICLKPFAKLILNLYAFLFKEEREIDLLILDALGDLQQINEAIICRLDTIRLIERNQVDSNLP
jgi:hypothetical protein